MALPDDQLNAIYGACEVGINTSSAEGWGLVSFEHAVTAAAQIVPAHTGCQELWQGHAEMLLPAATVIGTEDLKQYVILSDQAVADSLERLYRDAGYRRSMSMAAYSNATRVEYTWSHISERWRDVFEAEMSTLSESPQTA